LGKYWSRSRPFKNDRNRFKNDRNRFKNDHNRFKKDDNRFSANGRGHYHVYYRLSLDQANFSGSNAPSLTKIAPELTKISTIHRPF